MSTLPPLPPTATRLLATALGTAVVPSSSAGAAPLDASSDSKEGASGTDTGFVHVSKGTEAAIIVVVVIVAVFGRKHH